ncbi:hypothetical protein BDN71DRAFT_806382 [Pleurotus eryngii]|uniref:Protein-S-isoprenylcysteine O-methyltransferase n=1 Tax=Pleurotus eryngii TaxID=5323 RepID=A0A9P6DGF3_PLEER|nr:hypothetical protein BDN71DRAFT_806382 [Pleurotus eryngii]
MSLARVVLVLIQAVSNQWACTPPNPTPPKARYHTDELYILQIAPLIFKVHQAIIWLCTTFEVLFYLGTLLPVSSPTSFINSLVCPSQCNLKVTPLFVIGVMASVLGTYVRLDCFKALGELFTFDLTVLPQHRLVTTRFYAHVRHPAYTGSMLLVAGLACSHLSRGSWLTECGPLYAPGSAIVVWAAWWIWTLAVGISRADAEDKQMKKLFQTEWEEYAANVPWWFLPGLI